MIEKILDDCGIDYEERSDEYWACCPMHKERTGRDDRNPSWSINKNGAHYCFSCHYKGNLYVLIRDLKGESAARAYRGEVETFGRTADINVRAVKGKATDWVYERKREAKKAQGLPETYLAMFDPTIPRYALEARDIGPMAAERYEVHWNDGSWILPFRHPSGYLIGWQEKEEGGRRFKNQPLEMKKGSTLFGYHVVQPELQVFLVESPLDAVRLYDYGYPAMALAGSKATHTQVKLLMGFDRVILALDNDEAGIAATHMLRRELPHALPITYHNKEYKDPGEMPLVILDSTLRRFV